MSIPDNLTNINQQIEAAAVAAGRDPASVRLVAVTKTMSAVYVNEAIAAGVTDIGENRVQEAADKFPLLRGNVRRHLIGHLQSNKARTAIELFDYIHTVDSIKLAERLDHIAKELGRHPVVLAQVDLGKEATKSGIDENELYDLARCLASCTQLDFRGLMTIPPFFPDANATRPYFHRLHELLIELNTRAITPKPLSELSMGMSHDFAVAIAEGATLVRVGTAIFGTRQ